MYCFPVQAVVNANYEFLYMSALCTGNTHDSVAFGCSGLSRRLREIGLRPGYWIAGDAAYECIFGIITPWSKKQVECHEHGLYRDSFNYFHSSLRVHVEQAFGILVERWGILWKPLDFEISSVPRIVSCCMRLHNWCISNDSQTIRRSMTPAECHQTDRAFTRWWSVATSHRECDIGSQGRRRDLEVSEIRSQLTQHLKDSSIVRPVFS